MEYTCSDHPAQTFPSREQYIDHIANAHSSRKEDLLKSQEIDRHAQLSPKPTNGCPLCSYTADNWQDMDKHLGFHLETLGLLGLPLATGLEKDEEGMASLQLEGAADSSEPATLQDNATEGKSEVLEQDVANMPRGEMLTLDALAQFREQTLAAREGHEAVVEMLRNMSDANANAEVKGADEESDGESGEGSNGVSVKHSNDESDIKSDKESSYGSLHQAAKNGDEGTIIQLLEIDKVDVDVKDGRNRTPLSWAAERGHAAVVELLLDRGANLESKDNHGQTPLAWAAEKGHAAVVELLLDRGANLESEDKYGQTPLSWAAKRGHTAVIELLLATGKFSVNARNKNGEAPLLSAATAL